jgi:membrane-bound lytic murein transglycosylase D
MTRWAFVAAASVALGCLPAGTPETTPAPETASEPLVVRAVDPSSEAAPRRDAPPPVPEVLARLAADSARDAEVLELLHDVESPENDVAPAEFDLESGFAINVARYAEHPRVQYYLRYFQGPARERMGVWLTRLPYYEPMIRSVLAANGLPGDLVYLALIESGYSNTAVSRSKATGMWQFMRATGREYGLRADSWVDERRDFIKATHAAARYLSDLTNRLGSHYLAAAAYNGGPGTVLRGLRRIGDAPVPDEVDELEGRVIETVLDDQFFRLHESSYLRRETKDYVPKLIAAAMIAKQPEKYGFDPIPAVEPFNVDSVPVTQPTSLETVAKVSDTSLEDIVRLNAHFLRRVTPPMPLTWVRVPFGKGVATTEALAAIPADERIPVVMHTIRRGETLTSIGRKYGVSAGSLSEFNGGISSRSLIAGASLRVPKGVAAMESSEVRRSASGVHVVRRGETLGAISREYGVSVARLRTLNGLGNSNLIKVGQRLKVEGTSSSASSASASASSGGRARTHLVRKGDTLSELAERYGVSVRELMRANNLRSAQSLKAGARITIPS